MSLYDTYNREERAICSHLFRLLHENINQKENSPLGKFLNILFQNNLNFKYGTPDLNNLKFKNVAIYSEMAMIRDAYNSKKKDLVELNTFMDDFTKLIMAQEDVTECTLYSDLSKYDERLNNIKQTHPKQIRRKAEQLNINLSEGEDKVYGEMQGMFNAKPDLVITIDNMLLVCEAKFTEKFDDEQLSRTWKIAQVWATLLYRDLGFSEPPYYTVFKLGAKKYNPEVSWIDVNQIAEETYDEDDRTRIAIESGIHLLRELKYN